MSYHSVVFSPKPSPSESQPPPGRRYLAVKAVVEWLIALVLLVCALPLIGLCALLVKLTSAGPAFYCQTRLGRFGRPYQMYKLRSMTHGCEAATGPVWSTGGNDPRVTAIGRILRDTHMDELPQLWNVLRGEMALVGPRPERPEIVDRLQPALPRYCGRLLVRPGVTGLAQLRLPPDLDLESVRRKLAFDLYYIQHGTLWLDARIALGTLFRFLGSFSDAMGQLLIKSDGNAAESGIGEIELRSTERPTVRSA